MYQTRRFTYSTITRQLAAVADWHKRKNVPDPQKAPKIADVLNQIKREFGIEPAQCVAIDMEQFRTVIATMGNSPIDAPDKALLCTGLAGAFRRSELVAVNIEDLKFTDKGVVITLLKSKSNQYGKPEHKAIFKAGHARKLQQTNILEESSLTCPVATLKNYVALLINDGKPRTKGPSFVQITHYRPELPYSVTEKRLSDGYVNRIVKQYLGTEYSAHSLRASFVTMAKIAGAQDSEIMQQTGHKSSGMIRRHTRLDDAQKHNAAERLDF